MIHRGRVSRMLAAACTFITSAGWAGIIPSGDSGADPNGYYVARNADGSLTINLGSTLNDAYGYVGYGPGCTGTALVTGTSSKWFNYYNLYIGNFGSGTLSVESSAQVTDAAGYLGAEVGSSGVATVTGAGSKWASSSGLYIGNSGSGTLNIKAGAQVTSAVAYLGYNAGSSGGVTVTGANSTFSNSGDLFVGYLGQGALTVADGGLITTNTLYAAPSDLHGNGTVTAKGAVLDADLVFDTASGLTKAMPIGTGGTLNLTVSSAGGLGAGYRGSGTLRVADGLGVRSATAHLGYLSGSTGSATISGAGSYWTSLASLYVGESGNGALTVEAGGSIGSTSTYVGWAAGSSGAVTVRGTGSQWYATALYVGNSGTGVATIESGAQINISSSEISYVGRNAGSQGTVTVTGTGTIWKHGAELRIGYSGAGTVNIEAGGKLTTTKPLSLGWAPGSTGVIEVNSGTLAVGSLTSSVDLYIGKQGTGTLNVQAGGQVTSSWAYIGQSAGSSGKVSVWGTNSGWTNKENVYVGYFGCGRLAVDAGGALSSSYVFMGYNPGASGTATVSGAGSRWSGVTDIYVGAYGSGSLSIQEKGQVSASSCWIANLGAGSTGSVSVDGSGSSLAINSSLGVGTAGCGTLDVQNGGTLTATYCHIGIASGSRGAVSVSGGGTFQVNDYTYIARQPGSSGSLTVAGPGSTWTSKWRDFCVGELGSGSLRIEAGGQVNTRNASVGLQKGSDGTATVTGPGSRWANQYFLAFGANGRLTVTDGGLVTTLGLVASLSNLSGNGVIETNGAILDGDLVFDASQGLKPTVPFGSGGALRLNPSPLSDLGVGYWKNGTLRIADGLSIPSRNGCLGSYSGATGAATVTGAETVWTVETMLVGASGAGQLDIGAGGRIASTTASVGSASGGTGLARLTGSGSRWDNSSDFNIGSSGAGTLLVEGGARLSDANGRLGIFSSSTGMARVTGAGSTWASSTSLSIGSAGTGTLTIADQAQVTSPTAGIGVHSALNLHVSGNDMLVLGNATTAGSLANNGIITFYADSFLATGTYTPISDSAGRAVTWSGAGTSAAIGGTWDMEAQTFLATDPTLLLAGEPEALTAAERLLVTDPVSARHVGAAFGLIPADATFSAMPMSDAELDLLTAAPGFSGSAIEAWEFQTTLIGDEMLLSFDVGLGVQNLSIWHLQESQWSVYSPKLLTYDGHGILSFTTTGAGGYAIAVPEPQFLAFISPLALALLRRRSRNFRVSQGRLPYDSR